MIAEPLASSDEEGAKRPPRVVTCPNSKVLSSSRGVPAPAADPTSRNRGHDRNWRAPNLLFGDVGPEAIKAGVVVQLVPRKGILLAAKAQEAAEGQDGVGDLTSLLVDHEPFNRANLVSCAVVDSRPLDAITLDQRLAGDDTG